MDYVSQHVITNVRVADSGKEAYYRTTAGTTGYVNLAPDPDLLATL